MRTTAWGRIIPGMLRILLLVLPTLVLFPGVLMVIDSCSTCTTDSSWVGMRWKAWPCGRMKTAGVRLLDRLDLGCCIRDGVSMGTRVFSASRSSVTRI